MPEMSPEPPDTLICANYRCRVEILPHHGRYNIVGRDADAVICYDCSTYFYRRCAGCDLYAPRSMARYADDSHRYYCESCSNEHLSECQECGEWYRWQSAGCRCCSFTCNSCQDSYNNYSDDDDDSIGDLLESYSYTPHLEFHGTGPVFLGLELEVSTRSSTARDSAQAAIDALGRLGYLKEDGSVDGFELVTHPMTHAYAAEAFPWGMLAELENYGCDGFDNGIHVHVSRDGFDSPAHVYRWLKLLYRNESAVTAIARRDSGQWAPFRDSDRKAVSKYAKGERYANRYAAVNVTNSATFEVRVFRASLKVQEVRAALDLVAASVEYTRALTIPAIMTGGWTWAGFMKWAADRPEYAALVAESNEKVNY